LDTAGIQERLDQVSDHLRAVVTLTLTAASFPSAANGVTVVRPNPICRLTYLSNDYLCLMHAGDCPDVRAQTERLPHP